MKSMDDKKFEAIMTILVPQVIVLIAENTGMDEIAASRSFYESQVYALLEQEETKLWHLSPVSLFTMFDSEQKTGHFEIPEET